MFDVKRLENKKHISLETYKKNNQPVRTPVWFVLHNEKIYVITRDKTGKIKRLRNNPNVKIAVCTFSGKITGDWISGSIEWCDDYDTKTILKLRRKKYGIMDKIARFVSKSKGDLIVFSIIVS